jgi:hypothetical protein
LQFMDMPEPAELLDPISPAPEPIFEPVLSSEAEE